MSATTQITIWCENCAAWEQVSGGSVRVARRELKDTKGWSSKREDGRVQDYCPACTQITLMYRRRKPARKRCSECHVLGGHKLSCSRREDGGQVRLSMRGPDGAKTGD